MTNRGFSHIGLSTLDLDKTRDFYENVLKFKAVRCDILKVKEGGQIRHIFFDTGRDQLLAFMEARGVPDVPAHYEAGINRGLGVPSAFYHFAFEAGSEAALVEKRNELIARGVEVTDVVDHDWAKSIYFKDPNGLQLEFCCFTRNLNDDDARLTRHRNGSTGGGCISMSSCRRKAGRSSRKTSATRWQRPWRADVRCAPPDDSEPGRSAPTDTAHGQRSDPISFRPALAMSPGGLVKFAPTRSPDDAPQNTRKPSIKPLVRVWQWPCSRRGR